MLLSLILHAAAQSTPEALPLPDSPSSPRGRPSWERRLRLADAGVYTMGGGVLVTASGAAVAIIGVNEGNSLLTLGSIEAGTGVAAIGTGLVLTQVGSLSSAIQLRHMGHPVPIWSGVTATSLTGLGATMVASDLMLQSGGVIAGIGGLTFLAGLPFTFVQWSTVHRFLKHSDVGGVPLVQRRELEIFPTASWGLEGPRVGVVGRF
ncbi:MAG TPA: hypothetical protein PLA94_19320 [Myxococcota bacterium]|nr:hypothetical protein [Myxococcota bacterium]